MEAETRPNQTTNKDKLLGVWIIGISCHIVVRSFISDYANIKIIWVLFCPRLILQFGWRSFMTQSIINHFTTLDFIICVSML